MGLHCVCYITLLLLLSASANYCLCRFECYQIYLQTMSLSVYKSGFISTAIIGFARSVMLHRKLQKFLFLPKLLMQSLLGRPFGLLKPFGQDWDSCCLRSCWHRLLQTSFCARLLRSTPDSTHKRTPARVSLSFYRRDSPPSIMETCMHWSILNWFSVSSWLHGVFLRRSA